MDDERTFRDVGGTKGGLGVFLLGLALLIAGGVMLLTNTVVTTGFWSLWGISPFGPLLLLVVLGVGLLFFGKKTAGWLVTGGALIAILVEVVAGLHVYYRPTSLLHTLLMFGLMGAGIGLIAKSLRPSR